MIGRYAGRLSRALLSLLLLVPSPPPPDTGGPLDLAPWRGKVVLLDFWASWCGPCRESFPWMQEMAGKYRDQGLVVVTVNLDQERQAADAFLGGRQLDFVFLYDPEGIIAATHDIQAMPTSILFRRDGSEALRHSGFRQEEIAEYERHIRELLEGSDSAPPAEPDAEEPGPRKKTLGARPWERGYLARPCMRFDSYPLDQAWDSHIYFSREASSGGRGFAGGGCGCN